MFGARTKANASVLNKGAKVVAERKLRQSRLEKGGRDQSKTEIRAGIIDHPSGKAATNRSDLNDWSVPNGWQGALPYGEYSVREAEAPSGYLVNRTWIGSGKIVTPGGVEYIVGNPIG